MTDKYSTAVFWSTEVSRSALTPPINGIAAMLPNSEPIIPRLLAVLWGRSEWPSALFEVLLFWLFYLIVACINICIIEYIKTIVS